MIQLLLTAFLACTSVNSYAQTSGKGWFSFEDVTNKVLYVTEVVEINTGKEGQWTKPNFIEGFLQARGWGARKLDPKWHYGADLEFLGNIESFKKFAVDKRTRAIERCKKAGFRIERINVPTPVPVKDPPRKASSQ